MKDDSSVPRRKGLAEKFNVGFLHLRKDWKKTNVRIKVAQQILFDLGLDRLNGIKGLDPFLQVGLGFPVSQDVLFELILGKFQIDAEEAVPYLGLEKLKEYVAEYEEQTEKTGKDPVQALLLSAFLDTVDEGFSDFQVRRARRSFPAFEKVRDMWPDSDPPLTEYDYALAELHRRCNMIKFWLSYNVMYLFDFSYLERKRLKGNREYLHLMYRWPDALHVTDPKTDVRLPAAGSNDQSLWGLGKDGGAKKKKEQQPHVTGDLKLRNDWEATNDRIIRGRALLRHFGFGAVPVLEGSNPYLQLVLGVPVTPNRMFELILGDYQVDEEYSDWMTIPTLYHHIQSYMKETPYALQKLVSAIDKLREYERDVDAGKRDAIPKAVSKAARQALKDFHQAALLIGGWCADNVTYLFGYSRQDRDRLRRTKEYTRNTYRWPSSLTVINPLTRDRLPIIKRSGGSVGAQIKCQKCTKQVASRQCTECLHATCRHCAGLDGQ